MDYDIYRAMREADQRERMDNRRRTILQFPEACELAAEVGMVLVKYTESHYQLKWDGWILNIYPGNGRLYADRNKGAPYLKLPRPWTLVDIVKEARNHRRPNDGEQKQDPVDGTNVERGDRMHEDE